jgi:hypothetical protein
MNIGDSETWLMEEELDDGSIAERGVDDATGVKP